MSRILTQDEINALLASSPDVDGSQRSNDPSAGPVIAYDFRRPDRISKDQIRSLHFMHDRFARNVTTSLGAYLRTTVEITAMSVEQFSYAEFLMSLPDPTAFYSIGLSPLDTMGALELNPTIAFTIVDRILGGSGQGQVPNRALTEIEQTVVDPVVKVLLEGLTETWKPVAELKFSLQGRETRPQMLPIAGRNEVMVLLAFDVKLGDVRGMLHVCIPASAVESTGLSLNHRWQQAVVESTPRDQESLVAALGQVPVRVTAKVNTRLTAREVVNLSDGDLLGIGVPSRAPIELVVGDVTKFVGRLSTNQGRASFVIERTGAPQSEGGA